MLCSWFAARLQAAAGATRVGDQIRHEGVRFDRAHAQTPLCVPSDVSLMTGRSPLSHGMMTNESTSTVMGRNKTVPALLRTTGYATCAIGKMHFTPERARHGFEETLLPADYYDWIRQTGSLMQPMRHGLGQNELYPSTATVPEAATLTSWIAEQCVSYIRDRRDPTIIFTSDHGEFLGDFGTSRKTAFRDPTARIPLLLRHPASA